MLAGNLITSLKKGDLEYQTLYRQVFDRMREVEPQIHAITTSLSDEVEQRCLEQALERKDLPLAGIPILIKDSFETVDFISTCGMEDLKNYQPTTNAAIVEKLIQRGAVVIGKTNTPAATLDYQCFNDLFPTTNNPFDLARTPGGSSGGSAAALACNYTSIAIGSDIGGSLRVPASFCGVYSLHPSMDSMDPAGHLPSKTVNYSLVVGPMANNIEDLIMLFSTITDINVPEEVNFSAKAFGAFDRTIIDHKIAIGMKKMTSLIEKKGISISNQKLNLDFKAIFDLSSSIIELYRKDVFDEKLSRQQQQIRKEINNLFEEADVLILPTNVMLAPTHNLKHDPIVVDGREILYWEAMGRLCIPFSMSGHPVVTIPFKIIGRLPFGVQIVGKYGQDAKLLAIAKKLDKIFPGVSLSNLRV